MSPHIQIPIEISHWKPSLPFNMWNQLPFDLLSKVFSILSPDSLACASSVCKQWNTCFKGYPFELGPKCRPPWFLAMTKSNHGVSCYAYSPTLERWHSLPLEFLPHPIHPIASIGNLIIYKPAISYPLQLGVCNPFTRQFKPLPLLNTFRTKPAIGVIKCTASSSFRIYVAGGMSEAPRGGGGALYEPTLEMYDSQVNKWERLGLMPMEFAVRLTVWTPNESVCSNGILYWITSARAYSMMGFEVSSGMWTEVKVPMADRLEFATLVLRKGRLTLIGGKCEGGEACLWELREGDIWVLIEKVPLELANRFLRCKGSWCNTKCVGSDEVVYFYRDLGSEMLVWMEVSENGKWEWFWVEGCCSIRGVQVPNFPVKGVLLQPSLVPSSSLFH